MTAKDQSEEHVDAPAGSEAAVTQDPEPNPVKIPDVQNDPSPLNTNGWHPFRPEDGPVDGEKYAALLKAFEDAAKRHADLEDVYAERKQEHEQCMRNLAGRTDEIKRLKNQIDHGKRYGARDLGRDILTTYDNLKLALAAAGDISDITAWVEGIDTLFRDFQATLERHGIRPIAPQEGDSFDPNLHEAMYHAPVEGYQSGQICSVEQVGFMLHDRLLRAARVGVAAAISHDEPTENSSIVEDN